MSTIKVYYWPMLGRGAPLVRMLEHTGTPYEYSSDMKAMASVCSGFGGAGDCFAPPVVVDGDLTVSQSTAASLYLGNKLGLEPPGFNQYKAVQYMSDIVDTFENNLGRNNEHGPTLKAFLEGDRFPKLMNNLEGGIKGPYYFGEAPSCADFFLAAHLDGRIKTLFEPLKAKHGVDALAPYPKVVGVYEKLMSTEGWKNYDKLPGMPLVKNDILDNYYK